MVPMEQLTAGHHGMVRAAAAAAAAAGAEPSGRSGRAAGAAERPEPSGAALRRHAFERDGFLILPSVLSRADVQKYRGMAEDLVARAAGLTEGVSSDAGHSFSLEVDGAGAAVPGFLHKVQGVNTAERRFLEIARHPAVFPIVQELLGSAELDIFGTKFFPKLGATDALPTGGISVRWHQPLCFFFRFFVLYVNGDALFNGDHAISEQAVVRDHSWQAISFLLQICRI